MKQYNEQVYQFTIPSDITLSYYNYHSNEVFKEKIENIKNIVFKEIVNDIDYEVPFEDFKKSKNVCDIAFTQVLGGSPINSKYLSPSLGTMYHGIVFDNTLYIYLIVIRKVK